MQHDEDTSKERERQVEEYEIAGHKVRIVGRTDEPDLWVDGERWRYFQTEDGFTLRRDAYRPPYKTLRDAVEGYFDFYESDAGKEE